MYLKESSILFLLLILSFTSISCNNAKSSSNLLPASKETIVAESEIDPKVNQDAVVSSNEGSIELDSKTDETRNTEFPNTKEIISQVPKSKLKEQETSTETNRADKNTHTNLEAEEPNRDMSINPEPAQSKSEKTTRSNSTSGELETAKVDTQLNEEKLPTNEVDPTPPPPPSKETKPTPTQSYNMHKEWDEMLKSHVSSSGEVDYEGFKADRNRLESYLALMSNNPPKSDWSRNKALAYWINVYNAYTIKLIIDNYPLASITDLDSGKPWDRKWIKIGSNTYSLNNIENDIIRPEFHEPRIHFAVNCAAKSCPPLLNEAWLPATIESQFESTTKKFLTNEAYNAISRGKANVSKIFEWYGEDFGDLKSFLSKYSGQEIKEVSFMEYDWRLNKK